MKISEILIELSRRFFIKTLRQLAHLNSKNIPRNIPRNILKIFQIPVGFSKKVSQKISNFVKYTKNFRIFRRIFLKYSKFSSNVRGAYWSEKWKRVSSKCLQMSAPLLCFKKWKHWSSKCLQKSAILYWSEKLKRVSSKCLQMSALLLCFKKWKHWSSKCLQKSAIL